jgi:hypothetical protein
MDAGAQKPRRRERIPSQVIGKSATFETDHAAGTSFATRTLMDNERHASG